MISIDRLGNFIPGVYRIFLCLLVFVSAGCAGIPEIVYTPLEQSDYQSTTSAEQRSEYMKKLSKHSSGQVCAQYRLLGKTVQQRPLEALLIQYRKKEEQPKRKKLRILLMATQHGNEISGCEALLIMAGNWLSGRNPSEWMKDAEILIIPAGNPDGIQNKRRVNAQKINLSTDYGLLAAPESTAVNNALMEFKPHVVLDIHESAILKKKSLGAQGWLTDFEAQFEYANNPNVNQPLQQFSSDVMLPEILKTVSDMGLRCNRYIGEITNTDQFIRHGGLSAHNFRNKAGLLGSASFLLENRLDPSTGQYPTPRNIKERVRKQMLSINAFLSVCVKNMDQLIDLSEKARTTCANSKRVWLQPEYTLDPASPFIEIPLRSISTGELVTHRFEYRQKISKGPATELAESYRFNSHLDFFAQWLDKQGILYTNCRSNTESRCLEAESNATNGCLLPFYLERQSKSCILERLPFHPEQTSIERR